MTELYLFAAYSMAWMFTAAPGADPETNDPFAFNLNDLVGGGAGATLVGLIFYVGKLILDRTIPSRSDARANITILLEALQQMVKSLQDDRDADAKRLSDRQARIDALEEESDTSYKRRAEMQAEIIELRARVAHKNRIIRDLVAQLVRLGASVTGHESDIDELEITMPISDVPKFPNEDPDKKP